VATYRAQVAFALDTALPRDACVITPHYSGTDPAALAVALKNNIKSQAIIGATVPFTVKIYDAKAAAPNFPLATQEQVGTPPVTAAPREIALCLSFYGSFNRPRYRGRLYLPAFLVGGGIGIRPTSTQRSAVATWATTLGKTLPSGHLWTVYSRRNAADVPVTNYWVDDEWDTVRSRGMKPTTRTTGTIP
jgi:hypothetical protein